MCQIGKSFRNEITPGNFIFRIREFEQMELEFFCKPGTDLEWFQYWRTFCHNWLLGIGLKDENLRLRDHDPEELCFYSKATTDFEFLFPFGWGELWGVADRTDYDLTQHQNTSGQKMVYREGEGKDMVEYIPYVIEPSLGVERSVLAVLCDVHDDGLHHRPEPQSAHRLPDRDAPVERRVPCNLHRLRHRHRLHGLSWPTSPLPWPPAWVSTASSPWWRATWPPC